MRLDINLASQPYEDSREFWMRWGAAAGVAGLITLTLLSWTIVGWLNARKDHKLIAEYQAQIAQRDQTRQRAEAFLNRPENRVIRDESRTINGLIERKTFSWTRVLESMERVMPPRVHLVSIHPQLNDDNQLVLKMSVAGDSRDRAIELMRRMEETRAFAQTQIDNEEHLINAGDNIKIDINAIYVPGFNLPDASQSGSESDDTPAAKPAAKPARTQKLPANPLQIIGGPTPQSFVAPAPAKPRRKQ